MADLIADSVLQRLQTPANLMRDFALHADGGQVVCALTSGCFLSAAINMWNSPHVAISEGTQIGQCWTFPSPTFQLGVLLPVPIIPTHITIDHIPRALAANIGQAPRSIILWGIVDGPANEERARGVDQASILSSLPHRRGPPLAARWEYICIAAFEYDIYAAHSTQTFPVLDYVKSAALDFSVVVMEVASNWGAEKTCIYRMRVHGEEVTAGASH